MIDGSSLEDIIQAMEEEIGIGRIEMRKYRRHKDLNFARQLYVKLAFDYSKHSSVVIGKFIDRDHTSVLHLYKKRMEDDLELAYKRTARRLIDKTISSS